MNTELDRADISSRKQEFQGEEKSLAIIILGLFLVMHILYAWLGPVDILGGELVGNDGYTRLNRVQYVYEQGTWNNSIYPRSNAPYGESIHWTKPMDLILLVGAGLLSTFIPFSTGMHVWGVMISPLLHIVAFAGLFYLMRERLDRLGMILLVSLFLLPPILTEYFMIGRPDHHSLILAIFSWFLVGLHRGFESHGSLWHFFGIGFLGALGLWVSVEFLVPIGLFLVAYTSAWVWQGKARVDPILKIMTSMLLFLTFFLFLERFGEDPFLIEYDRISLPHEMALGLILGIWVGIYLISRETSWLATTWGRMGAIGIGGVLAIGLQWGIFPGFFHGPLVGMDPEVRLVLWDQAAETQPLQLREIITNLGIGLVALPYLVSTIRKQNGMLCNYQRMLWLFGVGIFIPLALYESRWTPYASILLIISYAEFSRHALSRVEMKWPTWRGETAALFFGFLLLFWPATVGKVMAIEEFQQKSSDIEGNCRLMPLTRYLKQIGDPESPKTILAFKDYGPELLYRTSLQVISTPMHRNAEGVKDMLDIMKAMDSKSAASVIQRRRIDLILICMKSKAESEVYENSVGGENFYEALMQQHPPDWLKEVKLPDDSRQTFRLFEVKSPQVLKPES